MIAFITDNILGAEIYANGGSFQMLAKVNDAGGTGLKEVRIYMNGGPTGVTLPVVNASEGVFMFPKIRVAGPMSPAKLLLALVSMDNSLNKSDWWPYLVVK